MNSGAEVMHEKVPSSVGDMQNHPRIKKSADSGITRDSIRTKACPGKYNDFEPHLKTVLLRDTLFVPSNEIGWFQFPVSAMVSTLFSSKFRMMRVTEWSWEAYTPSTHPGMSRSFSFLFFSRNATLSKSKHTERNTRRLECSHPTFCAPWSVSPGGDVCHPCGVCALCGRLRCKMNTTASHGSNHLAVVAYLIS